MPTLNAAGGTPISGADYLRRFIEFRTLVQGLNDLDSAGNPMEGLSRGMNGSAAVVRMWAFLAGGAVALLQNLDGRRCIRLNGNAAQNVSWVFRPTGGGSSWVCDVGAENVAAAGPINYPPTTTPVATVAKPAFGWTTNIQAWVRKIAGGDGSDGRVCMGFACNRTVTPSKTISRVGLIGDGLGGYMYSSVNCPDGGAGANIATDHDAGFFQPTDLVAPGTNWWHSRIKIVPATPTQPARIGCYHNGVLVKTFADQANFPRGGLGATHHNAEIEASILNLGSDAGTPAGGLPGPALYQLEVYLDDDYTL